jgi:hypothetical protein
MSQFDQRIGQVRHHPFRTAVQLRGNRLVQGSDLSDPHSDELLKKFRQKLLLLVKSESRSGRR